MDINLTVKVIRCMEYSIIKMCQYLHKLLITSIGILRVTIIPLFKCIDKLRPTVSALHVASDEKHENKLHKLRWVRLAYMPAM